MNFSDLTAPFLAWQFGVAAVAIMAIIGTIKRILNLVRPDPKETERCCRKVILTLANLGLGPLVALPSGFLMGETYTHRCFVGVCAGFLSEYIYNLVVKRIGGRDDPLSEEAMSK